MEPRQEIDLIAYFHKSIQLVYDYQKTFMGSIAAGLVLAAVAFFILPPTYITKVVIHSELMDENFQNVSLSTLNFIVKDKSLVTSTFKLSDGDVSRIKKIVFEPSGRHSLSITISTNGSDIVPKLLTGLMEYFQNENYLTSRRKERQEYYGSMILKYEKEGKMLDSLKSNVLSGSKDSGGRVLLDMSELFEQSVDFRHYILTFTDSLRMFNKGNYDNSLSNSIEKFSPLMRAALYAFFGLSGGVMIALTFIAMNNRRKDHAAA